MEDPLIEFKDVTKRFGDRTILKRVNLKIYAGDVTTIIGKSGVGKSVLLKHIIGLLAPDAGAILCRGRPIQSLSQLEWNDYRGQMSYLFQNNGLFDSMTVFENIALPLRQTTTLSRKTIERKVLSRIEQAELTDVACHYPAELSGGMQKRVAMSRALVTDPKIVLFDEPTTGQDVIRKNAILNMIVEYQQKFGFTAVLISHDLPDVLFISNRIAVLFEGEIIFQQAPEKLYEFDHPFMDELIQSLDLFRNQIDGLEAVRPFRARHQGDLGS